MNKPEKLVVEAELFSAMGRIWPGERNPLSPLPDFTIEPLNKKTIQLLQKRNLISPEGQVNPEIEPYFNSLLQPDHFYEISIFKEKGSVNYSVFFNSESSSAIYLHASPQKIDISTISPHDDFLKEIRAYLPGKSPQLPDENPIILPLDYAWIFAAVFDLHFQKQAKIARGGFTKVTRNRTEAVSQAKIKTALKQFSDSRDWLLLSFISLLTGNLPVADLNLDSGLGWLEEKNLIGRNKQGYFLANEYKDLVERITTNISLINLNSVNQKTTLQIDSQKIACMISENSIFIAAYRENEERILLKEISPDSFLDAISQLLQKPELLFPVFGFEIDENFSITCPICSQMQSQKNLICTNCGVSLSGSAINDEIVPILVTEPDKNFKKLKLAKLTRKSSGSSSVSQAEKISGHRKSLPWWLILLILLFLTVVLCFTFTTLNPITIRIR